RSRRHRGRRAADSTPPIGGRGGREQREARAVGRVVHAYAGAARTDYRDYAVVNRRQVDHASASREATPGFPAVVSGVQTWPVGPAVSLVQEPDLADGTRARPRTRRRADPCPVESVIFRASQHHARTAAWRPTLREHS